jgi:hypothetical protein
VASLSVVEDLQVLKIALGWRTPVEFEKLHATDVA